MRIKLVQDVLGADKDGNKFVRSTVRFARGTAFQWTIGREMDVSEATGAKMIKAGQAIEVKPEGVEAPAKAKK